MILNIWKAFRIQLKELTVKVKKLEEKIVELAMYSHEPKNYKEKCDEMEKRIEALEKKTTMFRQLQWQTNLRYDHTYDTLESHTHQVVFRPRSLEYNIASNYM